MAVRFWSDSTYEFLDPVGVGSTAGGGPVWEDAIRNPPWTRAPFMGMNEVKASRALELMAVPSEQIRQQPPPVPQQLFPQRLGYVGEPLTINDIFMDDEWTPRVRSWISGPPRQLIRMDPDTEMWSGSPRPAQSQSGY